MVTTIILIGLPGAGKTTIGSFLAHELTLPFYDTDLLIEEKYQKKCSEIYKEQGGEIFRAYEIDALKSLSSKTPAVISVGGGLPEIEGVFSLLDDLGICFYLHEEIDIVIKRRMQQPLPHFAKDWDHYRESITRRIPYYEALADYVIECENRSPQEIVLEIELILSNTFT